MQARNWWIAGGVLAFCAAAMAAEPPRLGAPEERFTQDRFGEPGVNLARIRAEGLKMFATPFNHADGYGDGPMDPENTTAPGGRPTLANNGTFLRINGLDGQTCVDCHALVSTQTMPPSFGIGGFGGLNNAPIFQPTVIDVADETDSGFAFMDGRLIVPPHLFGSGAVQLLAEEMTADLQELAAQARANPGQPVALVSKGVEFGVVVADANGDLDTSLVHGVDEDLVLRPFGRKGEFPTIRAFDEEAMPFHFGMQPVEKVGRDIDADGDGVSNEVLVGEMSALEIFITTMDRPYQEFMDPAAVTGFVLFRELGCVECHRPALQTRERHLEYRVGDEPPHYSVNLSRAPMSFARAAGGGLTVPLFSDLRRHDMGEGLAESFQGGDARRNAEFITAKLWGVADSAPYLHDGRALTLDEAIRWHGGEAQSARDGYVDLDADGQRALRSFLKTLRLPQKPNQDVLAGAEQREQP